MVGMSPVIIMITAIMAMVVVAMVIMLRSLMWL